MYALLPITTFSTLWFHGVCFFVVDRPQEPRERFIWECEYRMIHLVPPKVCEARDHLCSLEDRYFQFGDFFPSKSTGDCVHFLFGCVCSKFSMSCSLYLILDFARSFPNSKGNKLTLIN